LSGRGCLHNWFRGSSRPVFPLGRGGFHNWFGRCCRSPVLPLCRGGFNDRLGCRGRGPVGPSRGNSCRRWSGFGCCSRGMLPLIPGRCGGLWSSWSGGSGGSVLPFVPGCCGGFHSSRSGGGGGGLRRGGFPFLKSSSGTGGGIATDDESSGRADRGQQDSRCLNHID